VGLMEDDEMRRLNEIVQEIKDAKTVREVKLYEELVTWIVKYALLRERSRNSDLPSS